MYMSTTTLVVGIFAIICCFVATVFFVICVFATNYGDHRTQKICGWLTGIAMIAVIYLVASFVDSLATDTIKNYIQNGYKVYINGEERDETKINLDNYKISIDKELQEIYLTPH